MAKTLTLAEMQDESCKIAHYIKCQILTLDDLINQYENGDQLLMILDYKMYFHMLKIHSLIDNWYNLHQTMVSTHHVPVMSTLDAKDCCIKYNNLVSKLCEILTNYIIRISTLNPCRVENHEQYWFELFRDDPDYPIPLRNPDDLPDDFDHFANLAMGVFREADVLRTKLLEARSIVFLANNYDIQKLYDIASYFAEGMYEALCNDIMLISRSLKNSVYDDLTRRAQNMKNKRSDKLTATHWENLLDLEFKAIALASSGRPASDDADVANYFDIDLFEHMSQHPELMKALLDNYRDDELFDMKKMNIFSDYLVSENIKLFSSLLLRGNIIRSEIDMKLKSRFDAWLRGEDSPDDDFYKKDPHDETWYKDTNRIFKLTIMVGGIHHTIPASLIYSFIYEHFAQCILNSYDWFALYKFLLDKGYLKDTVLTHFVSQMNVWFRDVQKPCSQSETNRYSILLCKNVSNWPAFPESQLRSNMNKLAINYLHMIYTRLCQKHDELFNR